jgi:hypothetical protein
MKFSKLKKTHIIIIGSVLCVIAAVAMFFLQIKPQQEAYKVAKGRYDTASVLGNQAAENKAVEDLNKAIGEVNMAQAQLDAQMRRRMPDLSFARRDLGMLQLWNEQIRTLGPLLESFARDPKVKVLFSGFDIPAPPQNPNDQVFDQDVLVFPLGAVTVVGDFKHVMDNIRRWNNCRRLIMVGPPQVGGSSPRLAAAYTLKCFIFPAAKGGAKIPMAGGDATAAAAGGMPPAGGAPAPMPGAPAGPPM